MQTLKHWFSGIRIYIAIAIVLVSLEVWWWAHAMYGGSNLMAIRMQEAYAWLSLGMLLTAVSIGPLLKILTVLPAPARTMLHESRRLIGVGAAWFALLHAGITYVDQFRAVNPFKLADVYQQSFLLGVTALVILLLMAFTSFDRAFRGMGKWWFRLHRLVYVAVLVSVLHAFMIGTHATGAIALWLVGVAAVVLLGLHIFVLLKYGKLTKLQVVTMTYAVLLAVAILNFGITKHTGYNWVLGEREDTSHDEH